jgi:hypothetical protein
VLDYGGGGTWVSALFILVQRRCRTTARFHWEDHEYLTMEGLKELMGDGEEAQQFERYVKDT